MAPFAPLRLLGEDLVAGLGDGIADTGGGIRAARDGRGRQVGIAELDDDIFSIDTQLSAAISAQTV